MQCIQKNHPLNYAILLETRCLFSNYLRKEIESDLNFLNPKYEVRGEIPQNELPTVKITKTVDSGDSNSFPLLKGATVTIRDEMGTTEQLIETLTGFYKTQKLKGEKNLYPKRKS